MGNNIYITLTKKASDQLLNKKLEKIDIESPDINVWHTYLKYYNRRKCLLFINDLTRYSIFIYGVKKKDINDIENLFLKCLKDTLEVEKFKISKVNKYISGKNTKIVKYFNNSINGCVMDHFRHIPSYIDYFDIDLNTNNYINAHKVNNRLNCTPVFYKNYGFFALERMKEELLKL